MAGGWGSKKNGVRLGTFWDSIETNSDGSQARITNARIRIDLDVNVDESTNSLSWSGGAVNDGSASNINFDGSGEKTIKSVTGQWQDLDYDATKKVIFAASMSGIKEAGGTISNTESVTYPARAYLVPVVPTDLDWTYDSPGNFTITWTNRHSTAAPWTTVTLVRTDNNGSVTEISVPNPTTATSMAQTGLALNLRYTWYLKITNPTTTVSSAPTAYTPMPLHTMTLSVSSVAIGGSVTFTINKYWSSNTSTIYFMKNGVNTVVWDKQAGTSFTYTFTQADWAAFIADATSKVFVVGLETFSDTTSLGANTQNITVTVPAAAPYLPDSTAPTRSEQVSTVTTAFGANVFVKNKSRIRYTWSGSAGASATITKREILITRSWVAGTSTIDVTSASGYMYEEVPTGNGTVTVASRTTDSRGRVDTSDNAVFTVYDYSDPVINTFTVARCDSAGNLNNSGTYVKFAINVAASSVNPGSEANAMQYRIRLLDSSGNETGSDIYAKALNSTLTNSLTTGALGAGAYSAQAGYSFKLTLNDDLTNATTTPVTKTASISSEVYPLTIGTNGIAIGKVYNDSSKALDVVGMGLITGGLDVTGEIKKAGRPVLQDIVSADDITLRLPSGFYQGSNVTTAKGWPITDTAWQHLLAVTHSDEANYYSMQFSSPFGSSNDLYFRNTNNVGTKAWSKLAKANTLADVPDLPASKITSGTLGIDRIPLITPGNFAFNVDSAVNVDWNTLTTSGVQPELALGTGTNGPGLEYYYYVHNYIYNGTNITQMAVPYTNSEYAGIQVRTRYNGTWSPWTGFGDVSSDNFGSLSGSGGDQMGGYTKYANGLLVCFVNCRITPVANSMTTRTWTFPVAFAVARPAISVTADTAATTVANASFSGPSTTSVDIGLVRSNTSTTYIGAIAIGRWK